MSPIQLSREAIELFSPPTGRDESASPHTVSVGDCEIADRASRYIKPRRPGAGVSNPQGTPYEVVFRDATHATIRACSAVELWQAIERYELDLGTMAIDVQ